MELNTIIGAGIAIISSSVTALLAFIVNTIEAKRKRKWELEDEKRNNTKEIYLQRLNQLEVLIQDYGKLFSIKNSMIKMSTTKDDILLEEQSEKFPNWKENQYLLSLIEYFDDKELLGYVFSLGQTLRDLITIYHEFAEKIKNDEVFDRDDYINKKPGSEFTVIYSNVIKRIDFLKVKYLN